MLAASALPNAVATIGIEDGVDGAAAGTTSPASDGRATTASAVGGAPAPIPAGAFALASTAAGVPCVAVAAISASAAADGCSAPLSPARACATSVVRDAPRPATAHGIVVPLLCDGCALAIRRGAA